MAISLKPALGVVVTVAVAGTPVAPVPNVPDNCHTLLLYNTHAVNTALVQFVPVAGSFVVALAVRIPPASALTLAIGSLSVRPVAGAGVTLDQLFLDATGNNTVVNVTYVNGTVS